MAQPPSTDEPKDSNILTPAVVAADSPVSNLSAEAESRLPEEQSHKEELASPRLRESASPVAILNQEDTVAQEVEASSQSAKAVRAKVLHLNAKFVGDVSIPDGTPLPPSAEFTKIWSLENTGDTIPAGTRVIFVGGETFSHEAGDCQIKEDVATHKKFSVTLAGLRAPSGAGKTYTGFWRLTDRDGQVFGDRLWIECVFSFQVLSCSADDPASYSESMWSNPTPRKTA